jgi:hypothetical protein
MAAGRGAWDRSSAGAGGWEGLGAAEEEEARHGRRAQT